jgi:hypothetical protein
VVSPNQLSKLFRTCPLNPQQQQDIPRVMEIAKKFGLEILPPSGA